MKIRNKKTGEIKIIDEVLLIRDDDGDCWSEGRYVSLAELNDEWEDETEPLIKDEKIRKAVRAWAEAERETQVQVTHCRRHILSIWSATKENGNIDFDCDIEDTFDEGFYSINQLCGEEEECES